MDRMAAKRRKTKDERKADEIRVRLTTGEKAAWTEAARLDGRDLSGWIRHVANTAAGGLGK
jgi:uncharacterized protein (DUF1778 family)